MVQVGDKIRAGLRLYSDMTAMGKKWGHGSIPVADGTVIYVHPKQRFCRAKFHLPGGDVIESFQIVNGVIQDCEAKGDVG